MTRWLAGLRNGLKSCVRAQSSVASSPRAASPHQGDTMRLNQFAAARLHDISLTAWRCGLHDISSMAWRRGLSPFDSAGAAAFSPRKQTPRRTKPPDSPIDARAGYVFHNGGARVMGSAQALPERIDKDTAERVAGRHFCSTDFDALATQTPGFISREQLLEAARVRNLSFTLREKSQKKFDFGFVAEEKEDA